MGGCINRTNPAPFIRPVTVTLSANGSSLRQDPRIKLGTLEQVDETEGILERDFPPSKQDPYPYLLLIYEQTNLSTGDSTATRPQGALPSNKKSTSGSGRKGPHMTVTTGKAVLIFE